MTELINPGEVAETTEPAQTAEPDPPAALPVTRSGPSPIRIAIVAAGLVAILGGAAITLAENQAAAPDSAGLTTASTDSGIVLNLDGNVFEFGGPGFGHGGFHDITITAISGSNLSLKTADGWTRTIAVTSDTTFEKAGETIALADLEVGDQVHFKQTKQDDGTYTIDAVVVVLPHIGGQVTAISGSTITVEQRDGTSATIKVTSDTTYRVGDDTSAALSDIAVGDFVVGEGTENSDGSLTAARVVSLPDGPFRHHGPGLPGDKPTDDPSGTSTEG